MIQFPHADFVLPGFAAQPHGLASSITLAAFAYSRRTNQRRLEDPFYGFWSHIFFCLIFDLAPDVFLVPQLIIYDPSVATDADHSIGTIADNKANDGRPDFVIMAASVMNRYLTNRVAADTATLQPRFPTDFMLWNYMKILVAHPLVIAELKTCASRSVTRDKFMDQLRTLMRDATDQLEERADLIFNASNKYQGVNKLILIAACGEWWIFKIARRESYTFSNMFSSDLHNSEIDSEEMMAYNPALPQDTPQGPRPTNICRHVDDAVLNDPSFSESAVEDLDAATPTEDEWSLHINFGTKASNQRMYLIHELLRELRAEMGAGGTPDYDSEVCSFSRNVFTPY